MSNTTQQAPWQCQACFEDCHTSLVVLVDSNICEDCFLDGYKPQFEQALNDQTKYPVKWGATPLDIDTYSRFFSANFLAKWHTKLKEYAVPIKQRIFCTQQIFTIPDDDLSAPIEDICGTFLGSIIDHADEKTVRCHVCNSHFDISKFAKASSMELLEGQVRGKDYQLCPNETCGTVMTLEDGCNEVVCHLCDTTVCYLCGKTPERGHWAFGQPCPRFGNSDSANPIHDEDNDNGVEWDDGLEGDEDPVFPSRLSMTLAHPTIALTRAQEDQIFTSAVGRLLLADRQRLIILRHATRHVQPAIAGRTPTVVALVERLITASELYIAHLAPILPFAGSWQTNWQNRWHHADIVQLTDLPGIAEFQRFPGLTRIVDTHNHAWAGEIEARALALQEAEATALSESQQRQMLRADRRRLRAVHTRFLNSPMGGMAMEAAHDLIHLFETEIDIYVFPLRETDILLGWQPTALFGSRSILREEIRRQYRSMSASQAVTNAFPELEEIYLSYNLAWRAFEDIVGATHSEDG